MTGAQRQAYASGVSVWLEILDSMNAQRTLGIALDPQYFMMGLQDMAAGKPLRLTRDSIDNLTMALRQMYREKVGEARERQVALGKSFRIAISKQRGAKSDAGSWYLVAERGTGRNLRTADTVNLLVTGTLPDGTVFDASGQNGQMKTAKVGALLPAVAIGLQKVAPGGRIKIVVPPEKGYGDNGLPPAIPGGATLIFDIWVKGLATGEGG
ncbi:FKBP-type peptidyl-prolyl cis-trans isomerase [Citrobacter koseri]|uniref:FKBP-type peptidyl-prolyl cis-trans isomerase n=1 Tax=Citrobacter koseri TaxID=545 RepID=UPI0015F29907|nr:FKBP-type peptidyl-prolyl cis-trans isomerase [Citrobacter koseri]